MYSGRTLPAANVEDSKPPSRLRCFISEHIDVMSQRIIPRLS
jgi:hypothetical protein